MAVDMDLTNIGIPEFGPAIFHQNMNICKRQNKKTGGFVPPKVERDLKKSTTSKKIDEDGEEESPEFEIDGKNNQSYENEHQNTTNHDNSDHENLF